MKEPWEDLERAERIRARRLARHPRCSACGELIDQDDALHFKGIWLCDGCIEDAREEIDDEGEEWIASNFRP